MIRLVILEIFDSQKIAKEIAIAIAINVNSMEVKIDDFEENFEIFFRHEIFSKSIIAESYRDRTKTYR